MATSQSFLIGALLCSGCHLVLGFDDAGRSLVPRNHWRMIAKLERTVSVLDMPPDDDLGDPVIGVRYSLKDKPADWNLIVEGAVKIPRGDQEFLVSTGEMDFGMQVSLQRFFRRNALYATFSGVYFDSPDAALAHDQWIPTVVLGWETRLTANLGLVFQLYGSRSTVQETNLDELSAAKVQATLGLQWRRNGHVIRLGFTDNVANFDNTPDVGQFAETLERVCVETVESGQMTKDIALLVPGGADFLTTEEFLDALDQNLQKAMASG